MGSTLFVPTKLTFSEYLRCLNFPLWTFWLAKTKQGKESNLFRDKVPTRSGKFKHLKFSENVHFAGANSVDSILGIFMQIFAFRNTHLRLFKHKLFVFGQPLYIPLFSTFWQLVPTVLREISLKLFTSLRQNMMKRPFTVCWYHF